MKAFLIATLSAIAVLSSGYAENLLENGSFELPVVTGRVATADGGNPAKVKGTAWEHLEVKPGAEGGSLITGITNEMARTGKQSLFVDFQKLTAPSRHLSLETNLIPVKALQSYRVSMWGRIDGKRPLSLDERRPYLWINAQFLKADRETEAADSQLGIQMTPGAIVPGDINELIFVSWKWKESFTIVETPADTAFLQVTWTWGVPSDEGETDGVIFWDDAAIEESTPVTPPAGEAKKEAAVGAPGEDAPVTSEKAPVPSKREIEDLE
jgi:hypothetical protein